MYDIEKLMKFVNDYERDKDSVVREIKEYYEVDLYNKKDLHDIADNTSKEQEINEIPTVKNIKKMTKILKFKKTSYSS